MLGEGVQLRVEHHLPARRIVVEDQGPRIVEQHLAWDAAERLEGILHPGEPALLFLVGEGPHKKPARVAERRDEEEHLGDDAADLDPALAEVDLQLLARPSLEPDRRPRRRHELPPQRRNGTLHRAKLTWTPFSSASSWRITSALPLWRRNRSASQSARPSSRRDRDGDAQGRQSPCCSQRFTVFREQPSSAAIRFDPHPSAFRRTIADTSSGVFISVLRGSPDRGEP